MTALSIAVHRARTWAIGLAAVAGVWIVSAGCSSGDASPGNSGSGGNGGSSAGYDATAEGAAQSSGSDGSAEAAVSPTRDGGGGGGGGGGPTDASQGGSDGRGVAPSSDGGCGPGTTLCSGNCFNLSSSLTNCGTCGHACMPSQSCQNGTCGCAAGQTICSGACVDTTSDGKNCGACGMMCGTGLVCSGSKCGSGCAGTLTTCGSSCVDTSGSSSNCGSCGHACPSDQSCWMGACQCAAGLGPCGTNSQCVDITASTAHCGNCTTACATGASCTSSQCVCPTGQSVCSGTCVDTNTDPKNCGACGTTCTVSGTQCLYGGCIDPSSVNCGGGAMTGYSCTANASVSMGKYWLNNNQWGVASSGTSGQQCVWGTCQSGDLVGWGTNWNWTAGSGGVKTFVSLVFGWQWGWKVTNTGLPVQISAGKTVNCGWDFTLAQTTGTFNVAYDTWLHSVSNPGSNDTPTEEVMIWLYTGGGDGPIGPRVAQGVSLAGTTWDLHQGPGGSSWPVSSYVRTGNATTAVMNMMVFYNDLVSRGSIPNTRYLSSIQAGSEAVTGTNTLTTNGFYCRVQ